MFGVSGLTEMALLIAKLLLDDLAYELHALRMTKFSVLAQIEQLMRLSGELADILYVMKSRIRVRVRELLFENSQTLQCLKFIFRLLHNRILDVKERRQYVQLWISHHEFTHRC